MTFREGNVLNFLMTQAFISTPCMQNMRMGMIAKERGRSTPSP
jgi:hypothetical protein